GLGFEWTHRAYSSEVESFGNEHIRSDVDTALYGRLTYLGMQAFWSDDPSEATRWADMVPYRDEPDSDQSAGSHFAWVNEVPKIVFSTTLTEATWRNSRLIRDNVAAEVEALQAGPGGTMAIYASPKLVHSFIEMALMDEFRLIVHPVTIGSGIPLFHDKSKLDLDLLESRVFASGAVYLRYQVNY
ncbi:MAG TPA: dihydrofolate reductase family protein, partial [Acidimicrobiales bacterium]|nr:dihydrofolate reductase family protein [Acidimicrobiales bacterium]